MIERNTWQEFRKSRMLWFVNRLLHVFRWVIVIEQDEKTGEVVDVYPARTDALGFDEETDEKRRDEFMDALAGETVKGLLQ